MKFNTNWSENDEKKYTWLYNYIVKLYPNTEIDEFEYIDKYKRKLMSIIENNESWGDSSKEGLLFMIAKYLKNFGNKKYSSLYSEKGFEYLLKNRSKENQNKQTEKETINYRDHEYFINILKNIKTNDIQTKIGHYQYLLLSLLVLQPPLRTDFYTNCILTRTMKDNDKTHNFIKIMRRGKHSIKCEYIVNDDKVSKTKTYTINKNLSIIEIKNNELCKLINNSLIAYPRKYLFENDEGKAISQPTYISWLRKITKVDGINNDIMRSSYINWFYNNNKTLGSREELSKLMRHSVITAQRNYLKVDDNELIHENKEIETKKICELQKQINLLKENCNNAKPIENLKKKRRDVVYTLNKGSIPREETLIKYDIKYNPQTKIYF
jgi:hypothetical protein